MHAFFKLNSYETNNFDQYEIVNAADSASASEFYIAGSYLIFLRLYTLNALI